MSAPVLPDCTLCDGPIRLDLDHDGPVEVCQRCGAANRPIARPVNRREVREQVRQIRRTRPLLCPSCLGRRCHGCKVPNCECPGPHHPRRPVGDLTPEGMALLAGEKQGHLEVAELTGGDR